jgi:uncharacterized protein YhfF
MSFPIVDGLRALEIGSPGAMRGRLNQLILDGHKRATAGLLLGARAIVDSGSRRAKTSMIRLRWS